jgi:hypothetical protein
MILCNEGGQEIVSTAQQFCRRKQLVNQLNIYLIF